MIIVLACCILLSIFITIVLGIDDPPSPSRVQGMIDSPSLGSANFEQRIPENPPIPSKIQKTRKPRKRTKYANEEEAKEAKLLWNREYNRNWRAMVKSLPDGNELKEARKKRDREYDKKKREKIKSLPDGERGEKHLKRLSYHRERRQKLKSLPDDDPRKQNQLEAQKRAQKKYSTKRRLEDPEFFIKKQQRLRAKKQIAQQRSKTIQDRFGVEQVDLNNR